MSHSTVGTRVVLTRQLTEGDHACPGLILPEGCRGVLIDVDGDIGFRPCSDDNTFDDWGCYLSSGDYREEQTSQTIQINLGLCWSQNGESGELDRELGRHLVEQQFRGGGIVSEPYVSKWTADDGSEYADNCLAFLVTITDPAKMLPVGAIETRLGSLLKSCRQDAIAFETDYSGKVHSDVYYGPVKPSDGYTFDPKEFHYIK